MSFNYIQNPPSHKTIKNPQKKCMSYCGQLKMNPSTYPLGNSNTLNLYKRKLKKKKQIRPKELNTPPPFLLQLEAIRKNH